MRKTEILKSLILALALCLAPLASSAELLPGLPLGSIQLEKYGGGKIDPGALGQPVVIAFFISAGEKSATELKALEKLLGEKRFSGFTALAVMRGLNDAEKEMANKYLADHKIGIQLVFDTENNTLAKNFGIVSAKLIPSFYIFDAKGVFRASALSVITPTNRLSFAEYMERTMNGRQIPFIDMVPKNEKNEPQKKLIGKKAPDFSIPALNGRNHSISEFNGKKNVILVFWSPNCPHCRAELPKIQSYYTANRMKYNFEILAVTGGGEKQRNDEASEFARTNMITFPILVDDTWKASGDYGVKGVPMALFINKNGVVVDFISGSANHLDMLYDSVFNDPDLLGESREKK